MRQPPSLSFVKGIVINKFALKSEFKIVSITTVAALEVGLQSNVSIIMFHPVAMQSSGWRGQASGPKFTPS